MSPATPSPAAARRLVAVVGHEGSGVTTVVRALGGPRAGVGDVEVVLVEGRAALPLVDAVVFVLSSAQGLDPTLPLRWEEAAEAGLPRLVCVTQLDLPRADFDESVAVVQRVLGEGVHPLSLPMLDDDEQVAGLIGLLDLQVADSSGGTRVLRDPDPEHLGLVEGLREDLLETLLSGSEDDALFDAWLDGQVPPVEVLHEELVAAVRGGTLHPVLTVTPRGVGAPELLGLLAAAVPAAAGVPVPSVHDADGTPVELSGDPAGPLVARVGTGGLVRVLSGTLADGAEVTVDGTAGRAVLRDLDGSPLASCAAGDVCLAEGLPAGLLSDAARPLSLD